MRFIFTVALIYAAFSGGLLAAKAQGNEPIALITLSRGQVGLVAQDGQRPLQSFVKLTSGDLVALGKGANLQILYFQTGRLETWQGDGRLEVSPEQGKSFGLASPEVKILPMQVARQIASTPAPDGYGRAKANKLRAIATPDALAKLEDTYKRLRMETTRGDINPELYLLSGLYEMREFDRIEQVLRYLQQSGSGNLEVGVIVAMYQKAMRNKQESKQ